MPARPGWRSPTRWSPSAFYGVNSRVLGTDSIDEVGPNAGFYERATGAEICDYFQRVLEEHRLPSGQVRTCQPTFNAARIAFVESCGGDDAEKDRLCPPNPYPSAAVDAETA